MGKSPLESKYDSIYSETNSAFGGGEPVEIVTKITSYLKEGNVLELGAGQGRNALWLGKQGFRVEARDISQVGVDAIQISATRENILVKAVKADSREEIKGEYDVIVSTFMFHHLTREEALSVINQIKIHTKSGGLNVLTTFGKDGDFFRQDPNTAYFFPEADELREIYTDWTVLDYDEAESRARATKKDGSPMFNVAVKIIAQKPS